MNHYIQVSDSLWEFAMQNTPEALFGTPAKSGLGGKTRHIKNVIRLGSTLAHGDMNPELVQIALQLHDIGRSVQWQHSGSFNDRAINHRYNGLAMVEAFVRQEKCELTPDWRVVVDVMQYHGVPHMYGLVDELSLPYVKLVSLADDVENGCCGALGYLEDEKARDDKGYGSGPEQMECSIELLGYLERGEKFNKMELCHTYAEYFIFAATLATYAYNQAPELAKAAMQDRCYLYEDENGHEHWLSAVDGYCRIFEKHVRPDVAKHACEIMRAKFG